MDERTQVFWASALGAVVGGVCGGLVGGLWFVRCVGVFFVVLF